jgi:hypothetical protein
VAERRFPRRLLVAALVVLITGAAGVRIAAGNAVHRYSDMHGAHN